jgi:hypothetical protein
MDDPLLGVEWLALLGNPSFWPIDFGDELP